MRLLVGILFLFLTNFLMPSEELKNNLIYSNVLVIAHNLRINHKGINLLLVTNVNMEELNAVSEINCQQNCSRFMLV